MHIGICTCTHTGTGVGMVGILLCTVSRNWSSCHGYSVTNFHGRDRGARLCIWAGRFWGFFCALSISLFTLHNAFCALYIALCTLPTVRYAVFLQVLV